MKRNLKLSGADYLLLLLYLSECAPIYSAVRLTKMMFIFTKEISPLLKEKGAKIDNLPTFLAYNYGPFSKDVYEQVELFQMIEFIKVYNVSNNEAMGEVDDWEETAFIEELMEDQYPYRRNRTGKLMKYVLIKKGKDYVTDQILPLISNEHKEILIRFKEKICNTPIKAILRYVYTKYPEMTENSLIVNEVMGDE